MSEHSNPVLGGPPRNPLVGLTVGRMVHVVLEREPHKHRPGIITEVIDSRDGAVNIMVFLDGPNDVDSGAVGGPVWMGTRFYNDTTKAPGTWHWIERAD